MTEQQPDLLTDPPEGPLADQGRTIELEIEVAGTPEEVWRAIATGPGISSWYVPHQVDEREGGAASASFGPGPEMQIPGRVVAWEPPHRVVFDGGETGGEGLAFEWLVEARDGGSCLVRLVNTGFGSGEEWDALFDGMSEGWLLFLLNLQLHLAHFGGRTATSMLPGVTWPGSRREVWDAVTTALGVPNDPEVGSHLRVTAPEAPALAGRVMSACAPSRFAMLLDEPAPGTAIIAVEGDGDQMSVSVWSYLYGDDRTAIVARDLPLWNAWLAAAAGS